MFRPFAVVTQPRPLPPAMKEAAAAHARLYALARPVETALVTRLPLSPSPA